MKNAMFGKIKRQARSQRLCVIAGNGPDYQLPIIYYCQCKTLKCARLPDFRILFSTSFSSFVSCPIQQRTVNSEVFLNQ